MRLVYQRRAIEQQHVEEEGRDWQLVAKTAHIQLAAEPPHGHLKGLRHPIGPQGDGFAIEHDVPGGKRSSHGDDLGREARGDIRGWDHKGVCAGGAL